MISYADIAAYMYSSFIIFVYILLEYGLKYIGIGFCWHANLCLLGYQ